MMRTKEGEKMKNDIFFKNIEAMDKWYPDFGKELIAKRDELNKSDEFDIEIYNEISLDGEHITRVKKDNRYIYLNGKRNAKEPLDFFMERVGELHKYAPVYLIGLGSGLYFKKILEKADDTVNVIIYEPSIKLFINLLETVDISEEIKSRPIGFVIEGMNEDALDYVLSRVITYETMSYLKVEIHPNYNILYPEEISKALKAANNLTDFLLVNINSGQKFATVLARNQIENAKYALEGYNTRTLFNAIPHEQPGILVSAGPSLNKNIHILKKAKKRAFILAVDTAVKPLLKNGIVPDAMITMDALKPVKLFDDERIKNIPIVAPLLANSSIFREHKSKKMFYFDNYPYGHFIYQSAGKNLPMVEPGGSVACPGLSLLYKLGFETIILVGQDLAYTNMRTHADGTFEDKMPEIKKEGTVLVKGNYVDKIETDPSFKLFITWFNDYIAGMKEHSKTTVINATEGGAYIEGTELMTLEEALDKYCDDKEINYEKLIDNMQSDFDENEKKCAYEYLKSVPVMFDQICESSDKLKKEYEKVYKMGKNRNVNSQKYLKALKKIKKYTKECESNQMYQFIESSTPLAEYIIRTESLVEMDTVEKEAMHIGQQGVKYCDIVKECAKIIQEFAQEQYADL